MSTKSKSIKVGIISLITIFLIYFGMNFLKGINVLNNGKIFKYYEDVPGLTEGIRLQIKDIKLEQLQRLNLIMTEIIN